MKSIFAVSAVVAVILLPMRPATAAEIAFQGLSARSTRQQVLEKFPNSRTSREMCVPGAKEARSAEGSYSCDALVLQSYPVAGTSFQATFLFSMSGRLWQVLLISTWPSDIEERPNWQQIFTKYMQFRDLLTARYGQRATSLPCIQEEDPSKRTYSLCSRWQGSPTVDFDRSQGEVELDADGFKSQITDDTYKSANVSITYRLANTRDINRL